MKKKNFNLRNVFAFVVFFVLCQLAGAIGTLFTMPAIPTWYAHLLKPTFSPPNWLFAPVWTLLYTLMAVAIFLLWQTKVSNGQKKKRRLAITFFIVQLVFNACWSIIFFGEHNIGSALIEIVFMLLAIILTMYFAWPVKKWATWLLLPYLVWVSFATILNFALWRLN